MSRPIRVVYVTSNPFKREENDLLVNKCMISGVPIRDRFRFDFRSVQIKEVLEVDIAVMVRQEVLEAYKQIKEPCIVEHAGLVFDGYTSYPGGLTKPMWNVLEDKFLDETYSRGKRARAQAVVAYCDGQNVLTFSGETQGAIADAPRGTRKFYWDTIFIPDTKDKRANGKTYAEIVDDPELGLEFKVVELSQSSRAMLSYLDFRLKESPKLWPGS